MIYWVREIVGWVLIALGLASFWVIYFVFLKSSPARVFESWPMVFVGIFLFRGGIHLLKVAVAARICQQSPEPKRRALPSARLR